MSIGDESLDPMLEELTNGGTQSHIPSSEGGHKAQVVSVLQIPATMPVDLRAKLVICAIHLGKTLPEDVLDPFSSSPAEYGDLPLDIADAYTDNEEHSKALTLLLSLIHTESFNQAGVWLKHADCLHVLNELEQAAMSYAQVLCLAPQHTQTRLTLAILYSVLGMTEDALAVLDEEAFSFISEDASTLLEEQLPQQQVGASSVQGPAQVESRGDVSVPAGEHPLPKLT